MKKLLFIILITSITLSCKKPQQDNSTNAAPTVAAEQFVVKPEATSVKWTAYKTTSKVGVGGEFKTLNFEPKAGTNPEEALNDLDFSIPISSLFTNNESRDYKLKTSFFGAMLNTAFLKGTLKVTNGAYVASISMNGVTNTLPLEVSITDQRRVTLKGTMDLKNWNALNALASLNKVCFDLHKGEDGVSKTWEDVAIEINTFLRKN